MLIDRSHSRWFLTSAAILAVGSVIYSVERLSPHGVTGGSVLGLLFGIVGSLFMVIAALLAVRKRLPTWRVGSAKAWLRAHLWLGTVGFVLILFHSGFAWGGLLENLLWISFGLVVVTGFAGLALQQVIPKLLTSEVPLETFAAQISFLAKTMLFRADQLVATQTGPLEVPFEKLTPFATAVLKQQGVLKRESDLPKELAKVYANVPQPEGEKKGHAAEKPTAVPKVTTEASATATPAVAVTPPEPTSNQAAPATKPKSPLELMQEKKAAAAKKVDSTEAESKEAASVPTASVTEPTATKPKSPLELMREKKAAAQKADSKETESKEAASVPAASVTEPTATKPKSPLELMREKKAAAQSTAMTAGEKLSEKGEGEAPTEPQAAGQHGSAGALPSPSPAVSEKKLSPMDVMRAKMSAEKGSPADLPAETPKPLTVAEKIAPPVAKKPMPISKPVANTDASTASAASKPKAVVISSIQVDELRKFHLEIVRPYLDKGISPQHGLNESTTARRLFGQLKSDLPAELHEVLDQLATFCEERRQFAVQKRLHRWMHWWLILHIPPSIALLVLFVAHVVMSLRVVPFGR